MGALVPLSGMNGRILDETKNRQEGIIEMALAEIELPQDAIPLARWFFQSRR